MQCFNTSENIFLYVFLIWCTMNFFEKKNLKKIVIKQSFFLSWKAWNQNGRKFSFTDDEIQLLLEVCTEYITECEYCGVDWELLRNKYEQIQEKLIQECLKNSIDGFPNSENASRL